MFSQASLNQRILFIWLYSVKSSPNEESIYCAASYLAHLSSANGVNECACAYVT